MRRITNVVIVMVLVLLFGFTAEARQKLICVDPGHGGHDSGAVGCGLKEKDVVLDVGKRLRTLLQNAGFRVIMTRDTDVFIPLSGRTSYANSHGADRFVSIHNNAASSSAANGTETFCARGASSKSVDLRDKIQEEMLAVWHLRNRGGKTAGYYVLRHTNMPATLSELAFITNCSKDAVFLGSSTERQRAAEAHLRAILRHFGMNTDVPPTDGDVDGDEDDPGNTGGSGRLQGVVYEDVGLGAIDTSRRLTGATVKIVETGDTLTASGVNAYWSITLPAGSYTVRVSMSGFYENQATCQVTSGGTTWCSVGLKRQQAQQGEAKGVVFEDKGNDDMSVRLAGAEVTVEETGQSTIAGADGMWSFTLAPGTYTIKASLAGFYDNQVSCQVTSGGTAWCSIGLVRQAAQTGVATGVVFEDRGDGDMSIRIPDAVVTVVETGDTTTAQGADALWSFDLNPGTYTIRASKPGYEDGEVFCVVLSGGISWCSIGLEKETQPGGMIRGVVFENQSDPDDMSVRLPGATVSILETGDYTTASAEDAMWSFSLAPGTYTVKASLGGYLDNERVCEVYSDATTWCSVGLSKESAETEIVQGVVYEDLGNGRMDIRLPGAVVRILGTGLAQTAQGSSAYWSFEVPAGTYTIEASLTGYYDGQRTCEVLPNQSNWCSIGLVSQ